jgi:hypothetical protein
VVQLVGVDHGSDRLHLAVGDVEGEDVDDAPIGVVVPGAGEDLTAVRLGLAGDARDLFVVVAEHLVQQEHRAFGRSQALHQDEEGHRQRVGHLRAFGGIGFAPKKCPTGAVRATRRPRRIPAAPARTSGG